MYHSISIGSKNTWDDWHLIPSTRPVFKQPTLKTNFIDIPGGNGQLDLSQALTGYPIYNNREGQLEFNVVNEPTHPWFRPWYDLCSEIANYLSGKRFRVVLEDDKEYYYEGTMTLNEWKSDKNWSKIVLDYNLDPFKWYGRTTLEDWNWDPFNFFTGIITINDFRNIPINSYRSNTVTIDEEYLGKAPTCPKFTVTTSDGQGATVVFIDSVRGISAQFDLPEGESQNADIVFTGNTVTLTLKTKTSDPDPEHPGSITGTVSIDFRQGRL